MLPFSWDAFPTVETIRKSSRQSVQWDKIPDDQIYQLMRLLEGHNSIFADQAREELARRCAAGFIVPELETPPPPQTDDVPAWLKIFPFTLLWRQSRHIR